MNKFIIAFLLSIFLIYSIPAQNQSQGAIMDSKKSDSLEVATFGGGCFWCVEAIFERVKGVHKVVVGYAGGDVPNPTYKQVTTGTTGHAEVCQIYFDPSVITYEELLEIFWKTHDPTTPNRQGADVGPQYRSIILFHNDEQRRKAEYYKKRLEEEHVYDKPIVTEIVPLKAFYPAEEYHQNYYAKNPRTPYCSFVIQPKVKKFEKIFKEKVK